MPNHTELLKELYYGEGAGGYKTANRLYATAKRHNQNVKLDEVVSFLRDQTSYQQMRQPAKRRRYPAYVSKRFIEVNIIFR